MRTAFERGEGELELLGGDDRAGNCGLAVFAVAFADLRHQADGIGNQRLVAGTNEAHHVEQRRDRAHRVGAAREAEEEDLVASLVMIHQEDIDVADVVAQAVAECEAGEARPPARESCQRTGRFHRAEAGVVVRHLQLRVVVQHLVQLDHVRAIAVELVRRAVAADDDVLGHRLARIASRQRRMLFTASAKARRFERRSVLRP